MRALGRQYASQNKSIQVLVTITAIIDNYNYQIMISM